MPNRESAGADEETKEQDRLLPIANVARIMKRALPENAKIAKDAKECVQECVSEFIAFVTSEASDRCAQEKRKTINGDDILWAMQSLGFENYNETLKLYLQKYREATKMEKVNPKDELAGGTGGSVPPLGHAAGGVDMSQAYSQQQLHPQQVHQQNLQQHQQLLQQQQQQRQQQLAHTDEQKQLFMHQMQQGIPPGAAGGSLQEEQQPFY